MTANRNSNRAEGTECLLWDMTPGIRLEEADCVPQLGTMLKSYFKDHMADVFSKSKRSKIMGKIRGVNTQPEMIVRSVLHGLGFRFRVHAKMLPGKPDIVLPRYQTAIFVHGCFWHGHPKCRRSQLPSTRKGFWTRKIKGNKKRDRRQIHALESMGWQVFIIWECETKRKDSLAARLNILLKGSGNGA